MFELIPEKTNKRARNLVILFLVAAALLLVIMKFLEGIPFLWVIQLADILLFVAAVALLTRYVMKKFIYRVEPTDNGADLTVTEAAANGKRQVTVCRIGLGSIKDVRELSGEECRLREVRKEKLPIYDYRPDLYPERSILIRTDEGGREVYVCLAYDERLLSLLPRTESDGEIQDS